MSQPASYLSLLRALLEAQPHEPLHRMRELYSAFLGAYPLCFGVWKRWAELELRHGGLPLANQVYERAVSLGHHCVELWSFYASHAAAHWSVPAEVRKLFERAAELIGCDYNASVFWDRYIAYESAQAVSEPGGDMSRVAAIYRRVFKLPLKAVDAYWLRFQQLSAVRPLRGPVSTSAPLGYVPTCVPSHDCV